jgi:hypothetical protein
MMPWLNVTNNKFARARQTGGYAAPLTNSYPLSSSFITSQNGRPIVGASSSQQAALTRVQVPGGGVGDPRASGSYWSSSLSSDAANLLSGGRPTFNVNQGAAPSYDYSSYILIVAILGIALYIFRG